MNPIKNENLNCNNSSNIIRGPGILYIFNHRTFDLFNQLNNDEDFTLGERIGTEHDVTELYQTFGKFYINTILYYDLTYAQIVNVVQEISTKDFSSNSCIIIAVLTHGFENNNLAARDKIYNFNEIVLKISTNRHLKSKPKIFILQACRGAINLLNMQTDGPNMSIPPRRYFSDEQYIFHSATEAFTAYRDESTGSPFIQTLCAFVKTYGSYKTISDIFRLIKISVQEATRGAQMPELTSNAIKFYTFGHYCPGASSLPVPLAISDVQPSNNSSSQNSPNLTLNTQTIGTASQSFANVVTNDNTLTWVKFCPKQIPENAVVGGTDLDGEIMHVGRAYYNKDLLPGKVFLNRSIIAVPFNYKEIGLETFEVLTGTDYSWVKAEPMGTVPLNAVRGGWTENGEILYVGRSYHDASLTPGKIQLSESCLYIPFGGREVKLLNYEVLVKTTKKNTIPNNY